MRGRVGVVTRGGGSDEGWGLGMGMIDQRWTMATSLVLSSTSLPK